jgi:hypothetical protein
MPKGKTSRPYNRAQKKLLSHTRNKTIGGGRNRGELSGIGQVNPTYQSMHREWAAIQDRQAATTLRSFRSYGVKKK